MDAEGVSMHLLMREYDYLFFLGGGNFKAPDRCCEPDGHTALTAVNTPSGYDRLLRRQSNMMEHIEQLEQLSPAPRV